MTDENKIAIIGIVSIAIISILVIPLDAKDVCLTTIGGLVGFITRGAMTRKEDSKPEEPAA